MYLKQVPFQLEKTVPGTFLMQGLLGGVLGGFVAALIAVAAWKTNDYRAALQIASLGVVTGAIVGVIKSILLWGAYQLTGIRMIAATRIAATSVVTSLLIVLIGRQYEFDETFLPGCLIWSLTVGIPVALLVGSGIRPWEIFTFGSVAAADVDQRSGSRSIPATLGTLPLRFLSITASAVLALYFASLYTKPRNFNDVVRVTLFLIAAGFYPLFSAYVTFRSPRKIILFVLGVLINLPAMWVFPFAIILCLQPDVNESVFIIAAVSGAFLAAWVLFLIARLGAKLRPTPSLSISSNKSIADAPNLGHHCLGSRFVEWQQRVA
jgi:hypothetical protein